MSDLTFGLTMTVMGMGVTFLTLLFLALCVRLLIRLFPFKDEETKEKTQEKSG